MREGMERRLSEAAMEGNATTLVQILDEDPLILDKIIVSCISQTPLHTAATLGHIKFVKELMSRKLELAAELDSEGCSPLHLAAAKGHVDVVRELLSAGGEVGLVRNTAGRTALHVAAIKGRAAVLAEMLRVDPELSRVRTDRGETGLQVSVKWNREEAVKVLGEEMSEDDDIINSIDSDGNTALHVAIANKNIQIIKYLLTLKALQVNALNKSGLTPLDVLRQTPRELRDMEIEDDLRKAGASSVKDLHLIIDNCIPQKLRESKIRQSSQESNTKKHKSTDWLGRETQHIDGCCVSDSHSGISGRVNPTGWCMADDYMVDDNGNIVSDPHTVGQSVMAYQEPKSYGIFMIFNTVAFLSSLSIILCLVSGLPLKRRRWMWLQMVIMWIAITALVVTYFITLQHMSPGDAMGVLREVTEISVLAWLTLMSVVFVGNVVRMNLWVLKKYGFIKEKRRELECVEDDQEDGFE